MSAPRLIVQIAIVGAQIFGRAAMAAGRQAVQNAKHRPGVVAEEAAGMQNASSGSATDVLSREHRLTLDEAHLVLNTKKGESLESVLKNYEHLFKANTIREPASAPKTSGGRAAPQFYHSHYIQSKVVRARERIEAEYQLQQELENTSRAPEATVPPSEAPPSQPPKGDP